MKPCKNNFFKKYKKREHNMYKHLEEHRYVNRSRNFPKKKNNLGIINID